ncbi:hypothetical protein PBY51_021957 [Eleginops maclovinus]|uniref:Uncharacterized protein n=1 Tax=Eleginops maclovinus TaxID=56733 RepID=A0AAN8AMN3_ELEMC|nr:hypothetical protein PBY51_021957 [Eleginops maclovinus]
MTTHFPRHDFPSKAVNGGEKTLPRVGLQESLTHLHPLQRVELQESLTHLHPLQESLTHLHPLQESLTHLHPLQRVELQESLTHLHPLQRVELQESLTHLHPLQMVELQESLTHLHPLQRQHAIELHRQQQQQQQTSLSTFTACTVPASCRARSRFLNLRDSVRKSPTKSTAKVVGCTQASIRQEIPWVPFAFSKVLHPERDKHL